jgi:uncharacterized protein YndB with AHSA1/START domain
VPRKAGRKTPDPNLVARGHPVSERPDLGTLAAKRALPADARVLAYEPPDRVVFSWDISPQWLLEADQSNTNEVEVRFVAETPERTRLEFEHRQLDRHGPGWESIHEGVDGDAGWPLYLARYADLVAGHRSTNR